MKKTPDEILQELDHGPNVTVLRPVVPEPSRFLVRTLSKFRKPSIPKLVKGFIDHEYFVLLYGAWSSGKSFFAVDLACSIAFGDDWRGRQVESGAVVYVAGEASRSIENRVRAWLLRRGKLKKGAPEPAIGVIGCAPDLLHGDDDMTEAVGQIEAFKAEIGQPIRLILFDTLHACAPGSKEDTGDTGTILARIRPVATRFGCAVVLVHHAGKDSARGARGSNSLEAAADVIVEIVEDNDVRTPIVRKLRDGELPELEPFVIEGVTFDADTPDPVRVGVHELTEPPSAPEDSRQGRALALRKKGLSLGLIARELGAPKTTIARWCKPS